MTDLLTGRALPSSTQERVLHRAQRTNGEWASMTREEPIWPLRAGVTTAMGPGWSSVGPDAAELQLSICFVRIAVGQLRNDRMTRAEGRERMIPQTV
ncbi:hypothetical protein SAMN00790413_06286 [Deinococcus hopiensis KR-140]|uniref:Uncharacterized protein n=1 Tax=Deinococcus hopiensis KR-140 TaxID=695939 RepID=A0A1W1VUH5_9DEIO|nr:hypothetical protein SAMN00790413_06286 [Deinococcus hopiensis KR-140]